MTEISELQTFVIATARLKVKELTPEEQKKTHYRNKCVQFIEKYCRGDCISRADKQSTIIRAGSFIGVANITKLRESCARCGTTTH